MEDFEKSVKKWSRVGSRATFGLAALELGKTLDDLIIITADTSTSAGLDRFRKTYPEKFLEIGIAEQNMIGVAAGLASEGLKVITSTFSPFQTMRCCDQIRVNLGYMQHNVCMVGLASGLVLGKLGYTHCCIEDIAVMRAIPGITVLSPADSGETVKALYAAVNSDGPTYIRLTGGANNPVVYFNDYEFQIGKAVKLREGKDVTIIATGTMVASAIMAAELLNEHQISSAIVDMHTIKPLDTTAIQAELETTKLIVTVEEHSIIGGLGGAVSEYLASLTNTPPLKVIGISDEYGDAGSYQFLLERRRLTPKHIANRIRNRLQQLD